MLPEARRPCPRSSYGGQAQKMRAPTPSCRLSSRRLGRGVAGRGDPAGLARSDYSRSSGLRRASAGPHKPSAPGPGLRGPKEGETEVESSGITPPILNGPFLERGRESRVLQDALLPPGFQNGVLWRMKETRGLGFTEFPYPFSWKLAVSPFPFFPRVAPPRVRVRIGFQDVGQA